MNSTVRNVSKHNYLEEKVLEYNIERKVTSSDNCTFRHTLITFQHGFQQLPSKLASLSLGSYVISLPFRVSSDFRRVLFNFLMFVFSATLFESALPTAKVITCVHTPLLA